MASYIIPKIGQKVKVNSLVWYRQYDSSLAAIRCEDFGFIEAIEYNGNDIRFSSYRDSDVVYSVYFPATPQAVPVTIYCSYNDLIFSSARVYSGADFDGDCVTGLTGVIPTCAMTWYESPKIDCCCGNVRTPVSGKVCTPMPASVLNDIFGSLLKDLDKTNACIKEATENLKKTTVSSMYPKSFYPRIEPKSKEYSPFMSIIDELATYDPMKEYVKNDVKTQEQPCDGFKINVTMPPRFGKKLNIEELEKRMLNIGFGLHTVDPLIKTVITSEKEKNIMSTINFRVKKIMHNGPATIVFWKDGTKTVVRLKDGDKYDPYAAFTAAVAKRLYGKTVKISEIVDRYSKDLKKIDIPETPPRELSVEELKAAAEKLGYRVSKKPKK